MSNKCFYQYLSPRGRRHAGGSLRCQVYLAAHAFRNVVKLESDKHKGMWPTPDEVEHADSPVRIFSSSHISIEDMSVHCGDLTCCPVDTQKGHISYFMDIDSNQC